MNKTRHQSLGSACRLRIYVGTLLLFWPCLWGYAVCSYRPIHFRDFFLLFFGAFWMRNLGCVYNNLMDSSCDPYIFRMQHRIAYIENLKLCGKVLFILLASCLFFLFFILAHHFLCALNMVLHFIYPFQKRWICSPQLFLGLLFSWGVDGASLGHQMLWVSLWVYICSTSSGR